MQKAIVTTSIYPPSQATLRFAEMPGWQLFVAGDLKTPHEAYQQLKGVVYLTPEQQDRDYPRISQAIGWRSIQRRNLAMIEAHRQGAEIIALVDDDNIPDENWGQNLLVGREVTVNCWSSQHPVFDPLSVTNCSHLWHRGFPYQLIQDRHPIPRGKVTMTPLVQADLWNGAPDIDALARMVYNQPLVEFDAVEPYTTDRLTPFNSQNTFLHRSAVPSYLVIPHVGRMDDIWGAYLMQHLLADRMPMVVFTPPTVYQDRNDQDVTVNLEHELLGYRRTLDFINAGRQCLDLLPDPARHAVDVYLDMMKRDADVSTTG